MNTLSNEYYEVKREECATLEELLMSQRSCAAIPVAELEELIMSRRSCAAIPVANEETLYRAAELGRQQGWNEAIEAARKAIADNAEAFSQIEYHGGGDLGGYREQFACEQIDRDVAALKIPTQEKAEG